MSRDRREQSSPEPTGRPWSHGRATVDGVRLHYVEAGDGPLVVLLHGFPEFWYAWHRQIPVLAEAGYRVVAPDMRGYNRSEKPDGVGRYAVAELAGDVVGLVRAVRRDGERAGEPAAVVGHDWGGVVAWEVAARHPQVVDRLAVLNAPHPAAYRRELRRPSQLARSGYAALFQLPGLPEVLLRAGDYAAIARVLREQTADAAVDEADVRRYRDAIARPGALTAALNYYRALGRGLALDAVRSAVPGLTPTRRASTIDGRIDCETLVLWGMQDPALSPRLTEGLAEWVPDVRVERFPDAGHRVQADAAERVNGLLATFLQQ